jgi:hypothetical protein
VGKKESSLEEDVTVASLRSLNVNGVTPAQMLPLIRILKVRGCALIVEFGVITLCCSLQATAPVKLQVEEALNKGAGSFQELLQQQKETLRSLQQDYSFYTELASVHPSVIMAQRESIIRNPESNERMNCSRGIMRQVTTV